MKEIGWGSICFGTRLEKQVDSQFFEKWSHLLWMMATVCGRPGDGFIVARDRPAHKNANDLVRKFLTTDCDSLLMIDSDADFGPNIITEMRDYEPGWEFDLLQAFYTRRGWPPEAIWFTRTKHGDLAQNWVMGEGTVEVASVGTHFLLIRREVFESMRDVRDPSITEDKFEWFYYPRHNDMSEDCAFSRDIELSDFRMGATTGVKVGHISRVVTGWETYQDFLKFSGQKERIKRFADNIDLVAEFLGADRDDVHARAVRGSKNVREGLESCGNGKGIEGFSPDELRAFYGEENSGYFYDLITWNSTPLYDAVLDPLRKMESKSVLVIGAGIGGEVEALKGRNAVIIFELPGALRDFLSWRYRDEDDMQVYTEPSDLREIAPYPAYDLIVAVDTLEHIHPESFESTLDAMMGLLKLDGQLYFRNNFGQQEIYPMHFDHSEVYKSWLEKNDLELYAGYDKTGVEIYQRKMKDEAICEG